MGVGVYLDHTLDPTVAQEAFDTCFADWEEYAVGLEAHAVLGSTKRPAVGSLEITEHQQSCLGLDLRLYDAIE